MSYNRISDRQIFALYTGFLVGFLALFFTMIALNMEDNAEFLLEQLKQGKKVLICKESKSSIYETMIKDGYDLKSSKVIDVGCTEFQFEKVKSEQEYD